MALTLQHQTIAQFAARVRQRYQASSLEEAARIAAWLMDRIDAGDLTEAQVRFAFGLDVPQWSVLKSKFVNLRLNYIAIQSARGE